MGLLIVVVSVVMTVIDIVMTIIDVVMSGTVMTDIAMTTS